MTLAHRTILSYPNWIDADPRFATVRFDGGRWRQPHGLGLANLRDRLLVRLARSYDRAVDSTWFLVDLGRLRDIRVVAFPRLVASRSCRVRVRVVDAMDRGAGIIADSGWSDLYPVVYPSGTLPISHPSFLDGRLTPEEAALYPMPWFHVFDPPVIGRYVLVEIDDSDGGAGEVDAPRLFIAPGWQPPLNMVGGASLAFEPRTEVVESYGGAEFFEVLEGRRVTRFGFDYLPEDEALARAFDMQRQLGNDGQLFWIYDPTDTSHRHRRSFLGRFRTLNALENSAIGRTRLTCEIAEVIA